MIAGALLLFAYEEPLVKKLEETLVQTAELNRTSEPLEMLSTQLDLYSAHYCQLSLGYEILCLCIVSASIGGIRYLTSRTVE